MTKENSSSKTLETLIQAYKKVWQLPHKTDTLSINRIQFETGKIDILTEKLKRENKNDEIEYIKNKNESAKIALFNYLKRVGVEK